MLYSHDDKQVRYMLVIKIIILIILILSYRKYNSILVTCYTVILQTKQVSNQSTMSKYFKPVFNYKLSFDPNKGEKHSLKLFSLLQWTEQVGLERQFPNWPQVRELLQFCTRCKPGQQKFKSAKQQQWTKCYPPLKVS